MTQPFGEVPTGAEFLRQQSDAFSADEAARAAQVLPTPAVDDAAPTVPTSATKPADTSALYAPYRDNPKSTFDVYAPGDAKQVYRVPLNHLLESRGQKDVHGNSADDYVTTVIDPDGERRGVTLGNLDQALAAGFKLETAQQAETAKFLEDHKGLSGDALAGVMSAANWATLGVVDAINRHSDPEKFTRFEALKNEHQLASLVGAGVGTVASLPFGGGLLKGAGFAAKGAAALAAETTIAKALASRAAVAGAELAPTAAKSLARQILESSAKLGVESAVLAAPAAVTEAALGDPSEAAETLVINAGVGAALGVVAPVGKMLFARAFDGIMSHLPNPAAEARAAAEAKTAREAMKEAEAVGTTAGDLADFDKRHAAWLAEHGEMVPGAKTFEPAPPASIKDIPERLDAYANEQAIKSHNPYKKTSDRLGEVKAIEDALDADGIVGGIQAAGKTIREYDLVRRVGENFEDLGTRIKSARKFVGPEVAKYTEALDEKGVVFDARELMKGIRERVLNPLSKEVGLESKAAKVERYLESFEGKTMGEPLPEPSLKRIPSAKAPPVSLSETEVLDMVKAHYKGRESGLRFAPAHVNKTLMQLEGENLAGLTAKINADRIASAEAAHAAKVAEITAENTRRIESHARLSANRAEIKAGDLTHIRQTLDEMIYGEKLPSPDQVDKQYKAIRGFFKEKIDEKVASELGPEASQRLAKLNRDYDVLKTLQDGAKRNIGRDITNRTSSLTDYIMGASTSGVGALAGAVVGGPVGALLGGGAAKLVGMFGNKYLRENYNAMAVRGADKLGLLLAEQSMRHNSRELDAIGRTINQLGGAPSNDVLAATAAHDLASLTGHSGSRSDRYKALSLQLTNAQANAEDTNAKISGIAGGISEGGAPQIADAFTLKNQQVLAYLARELPRGPAPQPFGPRREYVPSERDIQEYERKVEAAYDPVGAVSRGLARGTLTRTTVDTIKTLYPGQHRKIVERVMQAAADPKAPVLPAATRTRLNMLFGIAQATPADAARYQAPYRAGPPKGAPHGSGLEKMPDLGTDVQRVTGG